MYIYTVKLYVLHSICSGTGLPWKPPHNKQRTNIFAGLHAGHFYHKTSMLGMFLQVVNLKLA